MGDNASVHPSRPSGGIHPIGAMGADLAARRRAGRPGQHPTPGARLLAGDNRRRRATPTRPAGPSRCYSTSFPTRAHVTRGVVVSMKQLHDQYRDQVTFVDIVVRQAHPAGQRVPGSDLGDDRRRVLLAGVPHHGMGHRSGRESPGTPTERLRPGRPDRDRSPARWTACGLAPDPDARLFNVGSSAAGDRRRWDSRFRGVAAWSDPYRHAAVVHRFA